MIYRHTKSATKREKNYFAVFAQLETYDVYLNTLQRLVVLSCHNKYLVKVWRNYSIKSFLL